MDQIKVLVFLFFFLGGGGGEGVKHLIDAGTFPMAPRLRKNYFALQQGYAPKMEFLKETLKGTKTTKIPFLLICRIDSLSVKPS